MGDIMDDKDKIITELETTIAAYACLIDEYLRGYISHDEFVTECKKLPKLTTTHPLPGVLVER